MSRFTYPPLSNEPCLFTGVTNRLNRDWVFFVKRLAMGRALSEGIDKLDEYTRVLKEFSSFTILGNNDDGSPRSKLNPQGPRDEQLFAANMQIVQCGIITMASIKKDLAMGVTEDGFEEPQDILTQDGLISLRWVLHTARVDRMSPEEAYVYAQALIK